MTETLLPNLPENKSLKKDAEGNFYYNGQRVPSDLIVAVKENFQRDWEQEAERKLTAKQVPVFY